MKTTILTAAVFLFLAVPTLAVETMVFDSTNNYLGGCQLTDKSEWQLPSETNVSKIQLWYNFNQGETELPVKVFKDGSLFAEFKATRASCDPYQTQWCNADFAINKVFPAGKYTTEIPSKRQCLKPGGTGTVRLYSGGTTETGPTAMTTAAPTILPTATATVAAPTVIQAQAAPVGGNCNCNQTTIITGAAVTSGIVSLLAWLLLKKF